MKPRIWITTLIVTLLSLCLVIPALAQEETAEPGMTDEDVDAIAENFYYDGENRLSDCVSPVCDVMRSEIRALLEDGKTEQEVINEFVYQYGYKVLGISDDEVNVIAEKLYCPVCENTPLDTCPTQACRDWRNEIGIYLSQNLTEQQIIDIFVEEHGDRVVVIPKDPFLRFLSLVMPWVLVAMLLGGAFYAYRQWSKQQEQPHKVKAMPTDLPPETPPYDDEYFARLERDLQE